MESNTQAFQAMKDVGNKYYSAKEYAKAAEVYSSIIDQDSRTWGAVPLDLVRASLANRAASYLELGQYHKAIDDCTNILSRYPPTAATPDQFMQKVYFRLARSYYYLGKYDEALTHLDAFRKANGPSTTDSTLRMRILQEQEKQDQPGTMQPFEYTVRIQGAGDLQHAPLVFRERVPGELCVPHPPGLEGKMFLANLVKKHHDETMGMQRWVCWNCPKWAVSILHNPMSWLHLSEPKVIDFALPICENRGRCDTEGRKFIQDEMAMAHKARGPLQ